MAQRSCHGNRAILGSKWVKNSLITFIRRHRHSEKDLNIAMAMGALTAAMICCVV